MLSGTLHYKRTDDSFAFLCWAFGLASSFDCFTRRGDQEAIILSSLGYRDGRNIPENCKNIKTCKKKKGYKLLKKIETLYSDKQAKEFAVIVQSHSLFNSFGRWIVIITLHISEKINNFKPCIVLAPHKLRNFEHLELMTKTLYFRIIIKSTNCKKCFERLKNQRRDSIWKYDGVIFLQLLKSISKMTSYAYINNRIY